MAHLNSQLCHKLLAWNSNLPLLQHAAGAAYLQHQGPHKGNKPQAVLFTHKTWGQLASPALLTNGEAGQCNTLTLDPSPEATLPFLGSKNPPEKLRSQRMRLDLKHLIPNKDTRQKGNVLSTGGCSPEQHEDRGAMVQHPPEKG